MRSEAVAGIGAGPTAPRPPERRTSLSRVGLFWGAFILTRPLGAAVGAFLDKPLALALAILVLMWVLPQRAGSYPAHLATTD